MINSLNIISILIKSGGGTGPMKPSNQYFFIYGAKSCSFITDR